MSLESGLVWMERTQKPQSVKLYDTDGFKKRASCVCVRNESENEILLVSSSKHSEFWIIPGGGVEGDEKPEDTALREVREEAGVHGHLGRLLGVFENKEKKHRTNVYLLVVDKEDEEWDDKKYGRRRKWFKLYDAKVELERHKPTQSAYLNLLKGFAAESAEVHEPRPLVKCS